MTTPKELLLRIHWPDYVEYGRGEATLDTPEKLYSAASYWRERFGISKLYWRSDHWYMDRYCVQRKDDPNVLGGWAQLWERLARVNFRGLAPFVDATRQAGAKAFVYIPVFDEGLPPDLVYRPRGTPYPYQSRFSQQHPELVEVDRSGNERHWGFLSYAYPEVRAYRLDILEALLGEAEADGVHLCTRSYILPAAFGDQFGFSKPVVAEYKRRYGVDILQQDFDLDRWRRLRGEYFTEFLAQAKNLLSKRGILLSVAVPRGEYFGPPYGNIYLDWRTWVSEHIVDELIVNVISGKQLTEGLSGYGYLCNTEDDVGMNPISYDLQVAYGPLCKQEHCKLYLGAGVDLNRHSPGLSELAELAQAPGADGFMISTGNLGERFAYDKRQRQVPWTLEQLCSLMR